jgi:phosphatidylserine decarboxylase
MIANHEPIRFFNPATQLVETEQIYGEGYLRWAYENPMGRLTTFSVLQRAWFSQWYGWRMDRPASISRIRPFIEHYGVDESDFADPVDSYASFNEFFYRRLKPSARPIDSDPSSIVFPADGRHLAIPSVDESSEFYCKGQGFDLASFIGDADLAKRFSGGSLLISRLCPVDYHRFHFPYNGRTGSPHRIDGGLRSVSPIALRRNLSILWQNRRQRTLLTLSDGREILIVEIGATCVGRIHQTFEAGSEISKGAEKGYFAFGGSCVVSVFQPGTITFTKTLLEQSGKGLETYAKVGEVAGRV